MDNYLFEAIIPAGVFVSLVLVLLIASVAWFKIRPALIFFFYLCLIYFAGVISTPELLGSFSNPSLVTLMILIVLASLLERTVFFARLMRNFAISSSLRGSLLRLAVFVIPSSAFLNNTAIVAAMMAPLQTNKLHPPGRLLLPMSYLAISGGMLTLVGTSTNLVANSFWVQAGHESLGLFDFIYVGLPMALFGALYLVIMAPVMLRHKSGLSVTPTQNYFVEARVLEGSRMIGRTVKENDLRNLDDLFLVEILRDNRLLSPVSPYEVIEADDILVFSGNLTRIGEIEMLDGVQVVQDANYDIRENLREVVLSHESDLIGRQIKFANFRSRFDAAVVAVRRGSRKLPGKIGTIELQAGDNLVLAIGPDFDGNDQNLHHFYFVNTVEARRIFSAQQSSVILGGFIAALVLSALGVISLFKGFLILLIVLLGRRYTRLTELRNNFNASLFLLIGSALGIAHAFSVSGAADMLAGSIHELGLTSPYSAMAVLFVVTVAVTELLTNSAALAVMFPVAMSIAGSVGMQPLPFLMTITYAASASYLSPFGYQTNLMVYGPGNYRIRDYLYTGAPLLAGQAAILFTLMPMVFPFQKVV